MQWQNKSENFTPNLTLQNIVCSYWNIFYCFCNVLCGNTNWSCLKFIEKLFGCHFLFGTFHWPGWFFTVSSLRPSITFRWKLLIGFLITDQCCHYSKPPFGSVHRYLVQKLTRYCHHVSMTTLDSTDAQQILRTSSDSAPLTTLLQQTDATPVWNSNWRNFLNHIWSFL